MCWSLEQPLLCPVQNSWGWGGTHAWGSVQRQRNVGCTLAAGSWASHTSEAELLQVQSLFSCLCCFVSPLFSEPARGSSVCNCLLSPEVTLYSLIPAELHHPLRCHHTEVLNLLVTLHTITHLILSGCKNFVRSVVQRKICLPVLYLKAVSFGCRDLMESLSTPGFFRAVWRIVPFTYRVPCAPITSPC